MPINFPANPTNGQIYTNPSTNNQYVYVSAYKYWAGNTATASGGGGGASVYAANVGNNSANTFAVLHSLGKENVTVAVRENSSGYYVYPDIKYANTNAVILEFVSAPTTNQYKIIVLG